MLNKKPLSWGGGSALPAYLALVAGVFFSLVIWWVLAFRDHLPSSDAIPYWAVPLGVFAAGLLVFGAFRLRTVTDSRSPELTRRMVEVLRSGELDLVDMQRVAQALIAALPDPVYFRGTDRRRIATDEAWQKLFGVTRTAFVSNTLRAFYQDSVNPAEVGRRPGGLTAPAAAEQIFRTTIVMASGERLESTHRKAPLVPAEGSTGVIGAIVRLVERKEAEFFDMLGYSKAELAGKIIRDVAREQDHGDAALPGARLKRGAMISLATEAPGEEADGVFRWKKRVVSVVSHPSGRADCLLCSSEDITDAKLGEQRQAMERAVTLGLMEAETVSAALASAIEGICRAMEWDCGASWLVDRESREMRRNETWGFDAPELREFDATCADQVVMSDPALVQGMILRTYLSARPVWMANVADDPGLQDVHLLIRSGLRGAFGFPLLAGNRVLGVMVFYHRGAPEPDEGLLTTFQSVGSQIGQYVLRVEAEGALKFAAAHDVLTGLPNREMFSQRLQHAFVQARRRGSRLAVLFIDLDHFKIVNDTLGHEAGDILLCEVASRMKACLRASDTVARLGGDEFVVLLEDIADPMFIGNLAGKLIETLSSSYTIAGHECHVTASIGSSTYPDDCEDIGTLLKNADAAMYRAKEKGRNRFHFYSEQMNVHAVERMTVEAALRRALERGELVLHYQPKVDMRSGCVTGLEALVRWRHPELGLVPPAQFMQIANETGLIAPIGRWVVQTACATRRSWERQGMAADVTIAINLSRRQFMHGDLVKDIEQVLNETGCRAHTVALDITEAMIMHNPERAINTIENLKELGLQVVIDDFGTGYSSLASLRRFPIDALKIDRSFMDVDGDPGNAAIAKAIVAMAHSLKLNVIAEGVETRQQFDFLRELGCNEAQGFLVSKPLAAADAFAFVQHSGNCKSSTA